MPTCYVVVSSQEYKFAKNILTVLLCMHEETIKTSFKREGIYNRDLTN